MTCHRDNNSIFSNSIKIENTNLSLEITVFKTGIYSTCSYHLPNMPNNITVLLLQPRFSKCYDGQSSEAAL